MCLYCRYKEGIGRIINNIYIIVMINEFIKVIDVISIVILKVINVDYEKRIECWVKNEVL